MNEERFKRWLQARGITEDSIKSRIRRGKKVEEIVGSQMEIIVASSEMMREVLIKLQNEKDPKGGYANVLRKYWEMEHGSEFPQLRQIDAAEQINESMRALRR